MISAESQKGFKIVDEVGNSTVIMIKKGPDGDETIRCEFEAYNRPRDDDESAIIMLFDIIAKQRRNSGSLVFTCTPEPIPTFLSVRFVPSGMDHLDQTIFDGPGSDKMPTEINAGLFSYLESVGIDEQVFAFIKDYSLRKYEREALEGVNFTSSFFATISP